MSERLPKDILGSQGRQVQGKSKTCYFRPWAGLQFLPESHFSLMWDSATPGESEEEVPPTRSPPSPCPSPSPTPPRHQATLDPLCSAA